MIGYRVKEYSRYGDPSYGGSVCWTVNYGLVSDISYWVQQQGHGAYWLDLSSSMEHYHSGYDILFKYRIDYKHDAYISEESKEYNGDTYYKCGEYYYKDITGEIVNEGSYMEVSVTYQKY